MLRITGTLPEKTRLHYIANIGIGVTAFLYSTNHPDQDPDGSLRSLGGELALGGFALLCSSELLQWFDEAATNQIAKLSSFLLTMTNFGHAITADVNTSEMTPLSAYGKANVCFGLMMMGIMNSDG